jgi:tripartite ATP-independent transporter DctP family solute receptor
MKAKFVLCMCVIVVFLFGISANHSQAKTVINIATVFPGELENNEIYPSLVYFKQLVESRSGGELQVKIFPGGQLGSEVEFTRECKAGVTVQMSLASSGAFSSFYRNYQAIIAPFLFPDRLSAWAFFDSEFFANFMSDLQNIGLRYLGTFDEGGGFVALTNSLRPVKTPADLEGMRIRTEENPAHMAIMNSMGASAVPMAWGEVATALATKTAHGQFNAPSILVWAKLWETQKYVTMLNHIFNTTTWVVNDKFFKSLSPEHQAIVLRASREAILLSRGLGLQLTERAVDIVREHGMEVNYLTQDQRREFIKLAKPGYREWAVEDFKLDPKLVDSVYQELLAISAELDKQAKQKYGTK